MVAEFEVEGLAFDLDGVLVDTEEINIRSAFEAFEARGLALEASDTAHIVGRHPDDYVPVLARRFGLTDREQRWLRDVQTGIFIRLWHELARPQDGARETLVVLHERGYRLALATSGSRKHVEHCLGRFDLTGFFEIILTKEDVGQRKPDPEVYFSCARRFDIEPTSMLVVEDSEHGVRAAKAAGARCVAVLTPHVARERIDGADAVIGSLRDLVGYLA
jgi:HAD superfamily hydrolase (TIGR01509 family)